MACLIAVGRDAASARGADGRQRVVVDLASRHHRDLFIEQRHQRPEQARLRLTAKAEQDEVVLREKRVDQLWNDAVVVPDDAREQRSAAAQGLNQVLANLLLHGPMRHLAPLDSLTQFT